ncbi:hypothetical protein [Ligilactobacillus saerimneri]|uniref:hypothetical protein n=1 Tax=Ligilactobacillus saerimneri TaxID=228229 RepID=UPI001C1289F8|nr:hypothetical protein [Ligilactobacillus saerimneri]MBU5309194.1 hypothetical protein [Ligilactobacillus saerimneri]
MSCYKKAGSNVLNYIGLGLYALWLILLLLKYRAHQDEQYSFGRILFGNLLWYRNVRNLILLTAVSLMCFTTPIVWLYRIGIGTTIFISLLALLNIFKKRGYLWENSVFLGGNVLGSFLLFYIYSKL